MLCPVYMFSKPPLRGLVHLSLMSSQHGFSEIQCGGQPAQAFDELSVLCGVNVAFSNELQIFGRSSMWIFWETTSGSVFVFSPLFGATADTVHASTFPLCSICVPVTRGVIPAAKFPFVARFLHVNSGNLQVTDSICVAWISTSPGQLLSRRRLLLRNHSA